MSSVLPLSEVVRVNEIGTALDRTLEPDAGSRAKIARSLDLASLDAFTATLTIKPARVGWTLSGRVVAEAVQTCGLTLEPLPVSIDQVFSLDLVEAAEPVAGEEVEITLDDDSPDIIEDGRIDLGQYAVEQLALTLDPFPRKPGAEFVQPAEPADISPFAVLKAFRETDTADKG
ncbi:YceD family protein [Brevundimonas variabilis]|uniref:Uncharacterized metal-binding protein YceD (DUF177 family) n=1 Tax=Brevundimonas variabilis TaxID=74312 RepID=A0A7W9FDS3_9CAUL|nr:DUF177 domain-containing protein [Brevundimonas variabilis]MBB5745510.1 uncharacterized metal-binding protein YceD (DUF177 family) [Brevundimonas variabilis]